MEPYILNANNFSITPAIVQEVLSRTPNASLVAANHAQIEAWLGLGFSTVATVSTSCSEDVRKMLERLKSSGRDDALTFAGLPLRFKDDMPLTEIEFYDDSRVLVARIENLALPLEYV